MPSLSRDSWLCTPSCATQWTGKYSHKHGVFTLAGEFDGMQLILFPWKRRDNVLNTANGEWELYDLESDPNEMRNRYGDTAMKEMAEEL